jgi:hypothetical protein
MQVVVGDGCVTGSSLNFSNAALVLQTLIIFTKNGLSTGISIDKHIFNHYNEIW